MIRDNNISTNISTLYDYDGLGNILSVTEYPYTAGDLTDSTKTVTYTYGNDGKTGWNNLLVGVDSDGNGELSTTETITYDAIGNPTTYFGSSLNWHTRQLTILENDQITANYRYDADGIRSYKTVNGKKTTFQYIGDVLYYQCTYNTDNTIDNELYFFYDSYGNLASIYCFKDGVQYIYYVATNMQGDVLGIYNYQGTLKASYEYDTWGNVISTTDTSTVGIASLNPIRYRGYYFDNETGFYYLNSRYYDPNIGRFISADTTDVLSASPNALTDKNLFAYCDNDPVSRIDTDGEFWETAFDIATLAISVADVVANPEDAWAWAGLVGDAIDLIPFVAGVGEIIRTVRIADKTLEAADVVVDATKSVKKINNNLNTAKNGIKYTDKVIKQMNNANDLYHSFPSLIDDYVDLKNANLLVGGDGITRNQVRIPGSLNGEIGSFEYIIDFNGNCNHRFFRKGG